MVSFYLFREGITTVNKYISSKIRYIISRLKSINYFEMIAPSIAPVVLVNYGKMVLNKKVIIIGYMFIFCAIVKSFGVLLVTRPQHIIAYLCEISCS